MKTTRKEFITQGIYGGLALTGVTALMSACAGASRGSIRNEQKSMPRGLLSGEGAEILRYASLAPSGHNSQPWKIKAVSPEEWILCA
ncbi:MAG TPA: hypothetical protein PK544_16390, partial [Spirochaetota bacterium]|nr:hypothetical protein [Spirochaetota bacterium]